MKSLTISVNDVIDVAKSEPRLAPHASRALEPLPAASFTLAIQRRIEFTKLPRSVISIRWTVSSRTGSTFVLQATAARAADEKLVANTLLAMSSSP